MEWISCKEPPVPFTRVEIKDSDGRNWLGYYIGFRVYLRTEGHTKIQDPMYWRWLPKDSVLEEAFKRKIQERLINTTCMSEE